MADNPAYERAVERIDRAIGGGERESKLDGLHPLIEKSQPDETYRSDNSGLREAAGEVTERRRHPVKELIDDSMPDGVREVKTLGRDGNAADPKATFKQMDLRRVAADLADDRKLTAADERERYRAFEDGRDYDVGVALEDYAVDAAWRKFGEKTPEEIEHIRRTDPDQYQEMMRIAEQYRVSQESQRPQEQPQAEHQVPEADRQAQEQAQHQARVQAEQARLFHEQARSVITQEWQGTTSAREQIWQLFNNEFRSELQRGMTPAQVRQHLAQTNDPRLARFDQLDATAAQAAYRQAQIRQAAAEIDAHSNVAQKQQKEAIAASVRQAVSERYPELKTREGARRFQDNLDKALRQDGISDANVAGLNSCYGSNLQRFKLRLLQNAIEREKRYRSEQAAKTMNERLAKAPPVQRPGTGQHRAHGASEQISRLESQLDNAKGLNAIRKAAQLTALRRAARR